MKTPMASPHCFNSMTAHKFNVPFRNTWHCVFALCATVACSSPALAQFVLSYDKTVDTGVVYSPTDPAPVISTLWQVPQVPSGMNLLSVEYSIRSRLYLVGIATTVNVDPRTVDIRAEAVLSATFPVLGAVQTRPVALFSGLVLSSAADLPFDGFGEDAPAPGSLPTAPFVGTGLVSIPISGALNSDTPGVTWHNLTLGGTSPYTYLSDPKVFTKDDFTGYRMVSDLTLTLTFVPETGQTGALAALVGAGVIGAWWRRR